MRYARGFYPAERTADDVPFVWTAGRAVLMLRSVPRAVAWHFEAKLSVPRPEPGTSDVTLLVDRVEVARWRLARSGSHELQAPVPVAESERGVQIELRVADVFSPGRDDPRELGLMIERIALVPENRFRSLPLGAISRVAVSAGLLCAVVTLFAGLPLAAAITASASAALAALAFHESALYLDFDQTALPGLAAAFVVFGCGLSLRHLLGLSASPSTTAMLSIGLAATFVKLLVVLHPGLTLGDSVFHLNRLQLVREGTWFFTSQAPGGQFPYPVAFYVIVSKLPVGGDWIPLMRGFAVLVDGLVAVCLALTVAHERSDRGGLFTLGAWHALPALFQVQGIAYLTNAFGNLVAALSLVTLVSVQKRRWLLPLVIAAFCATVAFLTHVSSFLILLGTLLAVALFALLSNRRALAIVAMAVAISAATVAWATYYRHFTSVYSEMSARRVDATAQLTVPIQRAEAHQTVFVPGWIPLRNRIAAIPGYLGKYFGWPVIVLSMAGMLHSVGRVTGKRDELDIVLVAWIVAAFGFLLISLFTPVDLRYYLAVAPAVAALAGSTVDRWASTSGPRWRMAGYGLFAALVLQGIAYVVRFFITIPR